jgi:hypothetical protein
MGKISGNSGEKVKSSISNGVFFTLDYGYKYFSGIA